MTTTEIDKANAVLDLLREIRRDMEHRLRPLDPSENRAPRDLADDMSIRGAYFAVGAEAARELTPWAALLDQVGQDNLDTAVDTAWFARALLDIAREHYQQARGRIELRAAAGIGSGTDMSDHIAIAAYAQDLLRHAADVRFCLILDQVAGFAPATKDTEETLDDIGTAAAVVRRAQDRLDQAVATRDELIRVALDTPARREDIAHAAGVKEARLYQIRDGRR